MIRKNCAKPFLKIISWLLVVLAVSAILCLTFQNIEQTARITNATRQMIISTAEEQGIEREVTVERWWSNTDILRKIAHIIEFIPLGLTVLAAGTLTFKTKKIKKCVMICMIVSISDQLLKILVPGREFDALDLFFDAVGYFIGILLSYCLIKLILIKREVNT